MSVNPLGTVASGTVGSTVNSSTTGITDIGRDQFLRLLVEQLKHQDPMSPLDPSDFAAQLAQFSSVEQLTQLNSGMAAESQSLGVVAMLGRTNLSASMLGKHVLAESDKLTITAGTQASLTLDVPAGGGATLTLTDASGKEVASRQLGSLPPGRQTITLPSDLPAGSFTIKVTVDGPGGKAQTATTYLSGTVDSVQFKNGDILLTVAGVEIPMDTVEEIKP